MFFQRAVQEIGATVPGLVLGRAAYRAAAHGAGRVLASIPGVVAVYATGSLYGEWLQPGFSDIDLVLVVELASIEDELRLRSEVRARLATLNSMGKLFRDLDYLEERDLPLLRRYPDAWTLQYDERWVFLAGVRAPIAPSFAVPKPVASLPRIGLADALRRWLKASSHLADPRALRDPRIETRGAFRLFCDCLSALLGVDRQYPLGELLALAKDRGYRFDLDVNRSSLRSVRDGHRALVIDLLAHALTALESLAELVTAEWTAEGWPSIGGAVQVGEASEWVADQALDEGFEHVTLVSRLGVESLLLVVPRAAPARDEVVALSRLLARTKPLAGPAHAWAPRPVMLTRSLWRAGALLDPAPFVGALLARGSQTSWGHPAPTPPVRPREREWLEFVYARGLRQLWRARSRSFRSNKREDALAREVLVIQPEFERLLRLPPAPWEASTAVDSFEEARLLGIHREWAERWRALL